MLALLALLALQAPALDAEPKATVVRVAIAAAAPVVVVLVSDGTLRALGAGDGAELARWRAPHGQAPQGRGPHDHALTAWQVAVAPAGDTVALLTSEHHVLLWRPGSKAVPRDLGALPGAAVQLAAGQGLWPVLEYASTGSRLLAGVGGRSAVLFDGEGKRLAELDALAGTWCTTPLCWSADGGRFAAAIGTTARVFSADTGEQVGPPQSIDGPVESLALAPDGARLAIGLSGGRTRVVDLSTSQAVWERVFRDPLLGAPFPGAAASEFSIRGLAFSANGAWLAGTSAEAVWGVLYDAADGREVRGSAGGLGGKMGEPAPIVWAPDQRTWYYAFGSGGVPGVAVTVAADGATVAARELPRGECPRIGMGGMAVMNTHESVIAFTTDPSQPVWTFRP